MAENQEKTEKQKNIITMRLSGCSSVLGCFTERNNSILHLGFLFKRITVCGRPMGDVSISDVITITCPDCVAEIKHRAKHPEAKREQFGVVTHKNQKTD